MFCNNGPIPDMDSTSYRTIHGLDDAQVQELLNLYRGEWWSRTRTLEDVVRMLSNTTLVFGFLDRSTDQLVAFARVLTDGVYKAFLFDVIVHSAHRNKGLGQMMMDAVIQYPRVRTVETLELYCNPELAPFYETWGFSTNCAGCVLMRRPRS